MESLDDFENRKRYSKFTVEILEQIPDNDIELAIVDYVNDHCLPEDPNKEYEGVKKLPKAIRMVWTSWWLEAEVCNGGFNQYFWNPSGQYAIQAHEGLVLLGAKDYADVLGRAIATFQKEEPQSRIFREKGTLEAFAESYKHTALGSLDMKFYELQDKESLGSLRLKFIRKHPELFVTE